MPEFSSFIVPYSTAYICRLNPNLSPLYVWAKRTAYIVPLMMGHCATMTDWVKTTCIRQRATSLVGLAFTPKGCSERMAPPLATISSCNDLFTLGCVISKPEATTAIVCPPASRQPRWAAVSHPKAKPLMTICPCSPICLASPYAMSNPSLSAARAPMIVTLSSRLSKSLFPSTWTSSGASWHKLRK
ncbi:unknown [Bacteroides sp. CAG:702]|nr:unknown [Bacteroides sp. CAG:702]